MVAKLGVRYKDRGIEGKDTGIGPMVEEQERGWGDESKVEGIEIRMAEKEQEWGKITAVWIKGNSDSKNERS